MAEKQKTGKFGAKEEVKTKRLYRSNKEKLLGGVCGGIAEYFEVDPVIIRILWVILTLVSIGAGIIAYLLLWLIVPKNPNQ